MKRKSFNSASKIKLLICVIENEGGMAQVTASYLDFFKNNHTNHSLLVVSIRKKRSTKEISALGKRNIFFLSVEDLLFTTPRKEILAKEKVEKLVNDQGVTHVICDFLSFKYFKDLRVPLIADFHYVMAKSKKLEIALRKKSGSAKFFDPKEQGLQREISQQREQELLSMSNIILVNSQTTKEDIISEYKSCKKKKFLLVPVSKCLVSNSKLQPISKRKSHLQYHGRISFLKGVHLLPEIAKNTVPVHILGVNPMSRLFLHKGNSKSLILKNWTYRAKSLESELLRQAFHIFPSFYEPWGLALTKSMQVGAICIANKQAGGHCEQIEHGVNGFLLDFHHPKCISQIQTILKTPAEKLEKISRKAFKRGNSFAAEKKGSYANTIISSIIREVGDT